jgi:hypothetical protein
MLHMLHMSKAEAKLRAALEVASAPALRPREAGAGANATAK